MGSKVLPRDLFAMAKTLKYKHLFPTNELNRINSEEAYTLGDFELFSPRMKAYLEYSLVIPFALMYKVVVRSMELAGLPDKVDANQPLQWFCDLLKERKDFVKSNAAHCRPYPAEFLITDSYTDLDNKNHAHIPYIFSLHKRIDLINPMPEVISQRYRRRFFKPDMNYMPIPTLTKYNERQGLDFKNGNEKDFVKSYISTLASSHPHQCERCMSVQHDMEECDKADVTCPYCKSLKRPEREYTSHTVGVCQRLNCTYCVECQIAGHDQTDHPNITCVTAIGKYNFWRRLGTFSSKLHDPDTCYKVTHTRNPENIIVNQITKNAAIELQVRQHQAQQRSLDASNSRSQSPRTHAPGAPPCPKELQRRR
jgi:hypothetical protein